MARSKTVEPNDDPPRVAREKRTVSEMIRIYCRARHASKKELCPDCRELLQYAMVRLDCCLFGAEKPACAECPIHCYKPQLRERIREVMRMAGPRMLWRRPLLAIRHKLDARRPPPKPRASPRMCYDTRGEVPFVVEGGRVMTVGFRVNDEVIQEMAQAIVEETQPLRIVLFGSHARGAAGPDSDMDFLVIARERFGPNWSRRAEISRIRRRLWDYPVPIDILVFTREEMDQWKDCPNHVIGRAMREGRLLYEGS